MPWLLSIGGNNKSSYRSNETAPDHLTLDSRIPPENGQQYQRREIQDSTRNGTGEREYSSRGLWKLRCGVVIQENTIGEWIGPEKEVHRPCTGEVSPCMKATILSGRDEIESDGYTTGTLEQDRPLGEGRPHSMVPVHFRRPRGAHLAACNIYSS